MQKKRVQISPETFPGALRYVLERVALYDGSCSFNARVCYADSQKEHTLCRLFFQRSLGIEPFACLTEDRDYLVTRAAAGQDLSHLCSQPNPPRRSRL